jgi:hypothetical protein
MTAIKMFSDKLLRIISSNCSAVNRIFDRMLCMNKTILKHRREDFLLLKKSVSSDLFGICSG